MKKFLIPALAILAVLIGIVVFMVYSGYEKTQFANNLSSHIAHAAEEGLVAEYMGQKTIVMGQNLYNLKGTLTVYDRRKLYKKPEYDPDSAVYLTFPDGAEIMVAVDDSVTDGVFVHYKYKSKSLWLSIKKYKTMEWVTRAVSPEGIYHENIIVE